MGKNNNNGFFCVHLTNIDHTMNERMHFECKYCSSPIVRDYEENEKKARRNHQKNFLN